MDIGTLQFKRGSTVLERTMLSATFDSKFSKKHKQRKRIGMPIPCEDFSLEITLFQTLLFISK